MSSTVAARRVRRSALLPALAAALLVAVLVNLGAGAVPISPAAVVAIVTDWLGLRLGDGYTEQQAAVLTAIRAPRVLLCALVGAALAISGAALQGVFRNPLADPSVIGVSSGAAVGAVAAIVLGTGGTGYLGVAATPAAAFAGGLAAALAVYAMSRHQGRTEVVTMVLVGVAVSAICGAVVGLLTFLADDAQLRTIVFWTLGSVGGATWPAVLAVVPAELPLGVVTALAGGPFFLVLLLRTRRRHGGWG